MNKTLTTAVWVITCQLLLASLLVVSLFRLAEAKASYDDSVLNGRHCAELKSEIEMLRQMSSIADERQLDIDVNNTQIVGAAADSGMLETRVTSILRLLPVKIDETEYQREDIVITFRNVTIAEIVLFGLKMEDLREACKVTQIALSHHASRTDGEGAKGRLERWNAELILTQLVFVATRAIE